MDVYVLLTDNNVSYTKEFKGIFKGMPSAEQVCLMANETRPAEEWIGVGKFLIDNIGLKMSGYWLEKY